MSSATNPFQAFSLEGRRALVTGASSGLGQHFAITLASAGAEVFVAARRLDKLEACVQRIEQSGGKATAIVMDVCDRQSVASALKEIAAPHILLNNAGVTHTARALEMDDADWNAVLDTDLKGAWIVAQETARRMAASGEGGSIINVTSILASRVAGGVAAYCAAKAALAQLTRVLALEWARHEIRVNSLAPGYIATDLNRDFLASEAGDRLRQRIPSRRFGTPGDLDGALLLLASSAGAHMTGSEIVVDGGHLCSSL